MGASKRSAGLFTFLRRRVVLYFYSAGIGIDSDFPNSSRALLISFKHRIFSNRRLADGANPQGYEVK